MTPLAFGDLVLLLRDDGRGSRLVRLEAGATIPLDGPTASAAAVVEAGWGGAVQGQRGRFLILRPTTADLTMKVKRETQIVYPKDYGWLLAALPVEAGSRVIEMGSGSGAFATALARFVGPAGRIHSYDRRPEFQALARRNLERYGLAERVEWKIREAGEPFDETDVDAVFLDLPEPWVAAAAAAAAVAPGGGVAAVTPSAEQLRRTVEGLTAAGIRVRETVEILARRILVREAGVRPDDRMVAHTAYLVAGARVL